MGNWGIIAERESTAPALSGRNRGAGMMEKIMTYIKAAYDPLAVIVYGSYGDGTNNAYSDFDALVIVPQGEEVHDTGSLHGVQLDLWVYPVEKFQGDYDPEQILQIFDGVVLMDTDGLGAGLLQTVADHLAALPGKTAEELAEELGWCRKMLLRAQRPDAEGMYRWHWLLTDSLQIACDVLGRPYLGPKKSLKWLKMQHPELLAMYEAALRGYDNAAMEAFLEKLSQYSREDGNC